MTKQDEGVRRAAQDVVHTWQQGDTSWGSDKYRLEMETLAAALAAPSELAADTSNWEGLYREVLKRLVGAYIVAGLPLPFPSDWQLAIDRFRDAAQAQGHLAQLASERYDRILELERAIADLPPAAAPYEYKDVDAQGELINKMCRAFQGCVPADDSAVYRGMTAAAAVCREARDREWAAWGIIEVAVRNPSVAGYMKHWENRATKAEQELAALRNRGEKEKESNNGQQ